MPRDRDTARGRSARDPGFRAKAQADQRKRRADRERERYAQDPEYRERRLATEHRWRVAHRARHKDAHNARRRLRYATEAEYRERRLASLDGAARRGAILKYRYGMTLADYDAMLAEQDGVCAICKTKPEPTLNVDHSHETNVVRGLLCRNCNMGLGSFRDNPGFLRTAATFLEALRGPKAFKFRPPRQAPRVRPPKSSSQPKETT